jgi:hypothetical protein
LLAEETVTASDGEWDNHAIADVDILDSTTLLNNLSHKFMTQDVARFHRKDVAIIKM